MQDALEFPSKRLAAFCHSASANRYVVLDQDSDLTCQPRSPQVTDGNSGQMVARHRPRRSVTRSCERLGIAFFLWSLPHPSRSIGIGEGDAARNIMNARWRFGAMLRAC